MTVKDLIDLLLTYPEDALILSGGYQDDGFHSPTLDWATISSFDVEASRKSNTMIEDTSTQIRALVIGIGECICEDIDVNGHKNHQPHFMRYDADGILRS